jgi:hypothetical protein
MNTWITYFFLQFQCKSSELSSNLSGAQGDGEHQVVCLSRRSFGLPAEVGFRIFCFMLLLHLVLAYYELCYTYLPKCDLEME